MLPATSVPPAEPPQRAKDNDDHADDTPDKAPNQGGRRVVVLAVAAAGSNLNWAGTVAVPAHRNSRESPLRTRVVKTTTEEKVHRPKEQANSPSTRECSLPGCKAGQTQGRCPIFSDSDSTARKHRRLVLLRERGNKGKIADKEKERGRGEITTHQCAAEHFQRIDWTTSRTLDDETGGAVSDVVPDRRQVGA